MMNSLTATISSLTLLLVLGHSVCEAATGADGGSLQANQAGQQKQSASSDELVGQLLQLAGPTTGDQGASSQEEAKRQLENLLTRAAKKQQLATRPSKRRDEYADEKAALKRKWHKLVDDLLDSDGQGGKFAVSQPQARKRHSPAQTSASSTMQDNSNQDERLAVILIKRKPQIADALDANSIQPALGSNNLDDLEAASSSASSSSTQQQQHRGPTNTADHQRRILDDKFGILGQSIFTTNNQLGNKGVPKFGSEEQF